MGMKQILLVAIIALSLFLVVRTVQASGLTTSRLNNGVMVTTYPDGTTYLTTRVVDDTTATPSSSTTQVTPTDTALNDTRVHLPEGFATSFTGLFNGLLSLVLVISALLVFGFLIWGGFDWITSGGDKGKTDKARQKIVSAIIGLIIVAASYAVLNLVIRFLGFNGLNDVFHSAGTINGGAATAITPTPTPTPSTNPLGILNAATPTPTPL